MQKVGDAVGLSCEAAGKVRLLCQRWRRLLAGVKGTLGGRRLCHCRSATLVLEGPCNTPRRPLLCPPTFLPAIAPTMSTSEPSSSSHPYRINVQVRQLQARIAAAVGTAGAAAAQRQAKGLPPPRVGFLEWTDPLFVGGHWTPQLIHMAGGVHPLNPPK